MALNTDLVRNAAPNFATTLANSMLISDTSMVLQSATGLPTATAITLVIDATDPVSGASTPTLKEVVTGTLSGTTVSNLVRGLDGTSAQGHASGANVVMWITANLWNDWQTAYLVGHTQLGAHISNLPLTSPKITTGINDSNNNQVIGVTATSSAVNNLNVANSATGNAVILSPVGTDSNINLRATGKGTGAFDPAIPYKFSYSGTATTLGGSATAIVVSTTKIYDTGSNVSSGIFTAPIAGFYDFNFEGSLGTSNGANNVGQFFAYKNGSNVRTLFGWVTGAITGTVGASCPFSLQLAANDTIQPYGLASSGGTTFSTAVFEGSLRSVT